MALLEGISYVARGLARARVGVEINLLGSKSAPEFAFGAILELHLDHWRFRLSGPDQLQVFLARFTFTKHLCSNSDIPTAPGVTHHAGSDCQRMYCLPLLSTLLACPSVSLRALRLD